MNFFDEKFMILGRPHPVVAPHGRWLETKKIPRKELPDAVKKTCEEILAKTVESWNDGKWTDRERSEMKITTGKLEELEGSEEVWTMGIHNEESPVNPSGQDFFIRTDGSYIGFVES